MAHYTILTPYLDECGAIYIPGVGENGSAIRLNDRAGTLWRDIAANGACDTDALEDADRAFIAVLLSRQVIALSGDGDEA
ncbi:hypothetical protein AGRA3207_001226 [Actinomadura graeca]|uniref:Uncharacterized protein n=1 Tax=Actinomadura graeca TaxID=2750812 RepID=A0ABX8QSV3_9ACTN|nr:hypothetical protein [Actinomadura graeca]QXJ20502.1 hypothetical protein AGRA3207_001226 [Actinomadura graeca]